MRETKNNVFRSLVIRKSSKLGVFMAQSGEQTPKGWQPIPGTECTGQQLRGPDDQRNRGGGVSRQ